MKTLREEQQHTVFIPTNKAVTTLDDADWLVPFNEHS